MKTLFASTLWILFVAIGCAANPQSSPSKNVALFLAADVKAAAKPAKQPDAQKQPAEETKEAAAAEEEDEASIQTDAKVIGPILKTEGEMKEDVWVVTVPRPDLYVSVEGMDIPTSAGIYSEFRFFHCPCGKSRVIGQFVVADYEANDVVATLQENHVTIACLAPFLLYEKPRLMLIRFQAEGRPEKIGNAMKAALSYTGEERSAPQTQPAP